MDQSEQITSKRSIKVICPATTRTCRPTISSATGRCGPSWRATTSSLHSSITPQPIERSTLSRNSGHRIGVPGISHRETGYQASIMCIEQRQVMPMSLSTSGPPG